MEIWSCKEANKFKRYDYSIITVRKYDFLESVQYENKVSSVYFMYYNVKFC